MHGKYVMHCLGEVLPYRGRLVLPAGLQLSVIRAWPTLELDQRPWLGERVQHFN